MLSLYLLSSTAIVSVSAVSRADAQVARPAEAATLQAIDVVSGEGRPADAGPGTTVISSEDIERRNPFDLRDLFGDQASVQVGGGIPMTNKVYVNGIEETNLAVSINGGLQNNKVFHHSGTTPIDPSFLKAVRVDAGVAPADAGPGALAGSIAYETRSARDFLTADGWGAYAKTSLSSNGPVLQQGLAGFARSQGFDVLGYFNFGKGGPYRDGRGRIVRGSAVGDVTGMGRFGYETDDGNRFDLAFERFDDEALRPFRANAGSIAGRPPWEPAVRDYRLMRDNVSFTYSRSSPDGWWDPKVVLAYNRTEIGVPIYTKGGTVIYPGAGTTESLNGRAENRFAFGPHSITAGVDFYRDRAFYADRELRALETRDNVGLYAQARLVPWERLRLSFGGRGDMQGFVGTGGQTFSNSGLSYNGSGEFDLVPGFLTAKGGYSHVFGGVPLAQNFIMNPDWVYGTGPRPATSDNVVVGLEARYGGFGLEGRVFRTAIDNARTPKYAVDKGTLASDVLSKGFDITARYTGANTSAYVKYADIDVTIDGKASDSDVGLYLATPVGQIFKLGLSHAFDGTAVTLGSDMEIALPYDKVTPGLAPLKGYEVVNLFAEYRLERLRNFTFRADVKNLFDAYYADRATYGAEFATVTPLAQPGRTFIVSASARF